MGNKEIQEERMRGYFIQATREILKGEGLRSISVRNIADRAGYSYATLYNYFSDVKDLVFECVQGFREEAAEIITSETKDADRGLEKIKAISQAYMKYFVQYPGIFELFYLEKTSEVVKWENIELIYTFLDDLCADEWEYCNNNNLVTPEKTEIMRRQLRYEVLGMLLLYITRKHPASYVEFQEISSQQLDYILGTGAEG